MSAPSLEDVGDGAGAERVAFEGDGDGGGELVVDEGGDEVDGGHLLDLGLLEARVEDSGHAWRGGACGEPWSSSPSASRRFSHA